MNGKTYFDMLVIVMESYFSFILSNHTAFAKNTKTLKENILKIMAAIVCFESSAKGKVKILKMPNSSKCMLMAKKVVWWPKRTIVKKIHHSKFKY